MPYPFILTYLQENESLIEQLLKKSLNHFFQIYQSFLLFNCTKFQGTTLFLAHTDRRLQMDSWGLVYSTQEGHRMYILTILYAEYSSVRSYEVAKLH